MKSYRIHLIRHGLTDDNIKGVYSGRNETALSEEGKAQLLQMKEEYKYPQVDFVFSSPLKRCKETAEILYPHLNPFVIDELTEYNFGEFEGRTAEELHEKEPLFDRWLLGDENIKPPFGESNREFINRICNAFVKIIDGVVKSGSDNVAIITHGGVISSLLANFGIPEASVSEWMTPSGCGYTLLISHFLWMSGHKAEVIKEIPEIPQGESEGNYYDGWDYYPNDDDFDISEYLNDWKD